MYKRLIIEFIIALGASFLVTVLLGRWIIPILKDKKMGQIIREEGPSWHQTKAGTPTMGGICFIMAILLVCAGFTVFYALKSEQSSLIPLALTLALAVFNGMVGFVDDYCKLIKKQNEGLKAWQKFGLQIVAAILYIVALMATGYLDTSLVIPFISIEIELGFFYYIFALFLITGMVNSVNLTDGVDGLASSVTLVVMGFFAVVAFDVMSESLTRISATLIGGMIGFLVYNLHPAKVFMGDTGSLFLGGIVTGCAFLINNPLIIVIAGGIYVLEAASDIIQVGVYKMTHKRVFRMAPLHHHFELGGAHETKIVSMYMMVTALISLVVIWLMSL